MSVLGTGLALGGLGSAFDWGLDMLGGIIGNSMSKDTAKSLLKRQFNYQRELMKIQNDYNVYNYQHQHQWRVTDLRDAGLNPILSATSNSAVAPVGNSGVGLPSAGFPSGNSARMSGILRDVLHLGSQKVASEIQANQAQAANSVASATLNSAKARLENVKGQTAERVRDMYDATNAGFSQYGRKAGEAILNNSFGDLIRRYVPLNPERDMLRVSGQAGRHGISYDPERKVFIMKPNGGKK